MGNFYTYYNPKKCALGLGYNAKYNSGQLEFSAPIDPNRKGQPKKGENVFDHKNKKWFNIYPLEAIKLLNEVTMMIKDSNAASNSGDKNFGEIVHSPAADFNANMSKVSFTAYKPDGGDNIYYTLTFKKYENKSEVAKIGYTFQNIYEIKMFMNYLEFVGKKVPEIAATKPNPWELEENQKPAENKPAQTSSATPPASQPTLSNDYTDNFIDDEPELF